MDDIVEIQMGAGARLRVLAEVLSGVWAVHVSVDSAHSIGLGWTLTHVQTGLRIAAFPRQVDAEGAAMELGLQKWSGDLWLASTWEEFLDRSTPGDRELVAQVVQRHRGVRGVRERVVSRGAA